MEENMKNVYMCIAESLCCTVGINNTISQLYFNKIFFKKFFSILVTASTMSSNSMGNIEFLILKLLGNNSVNSGYKMDPMVLVGLAV